MLFRSNGFWGTIAAFLAVIVAVIALLVARSSDFSISINPIAGKVEKGESLSALLNIVGEKYNDQVRLTTISQTANIDIGFSPPIGTPSPNFKSTVNIKVNNAISAGDYPIDIIAIGAKNRKERRVTFFLTVVNPDFQQISMRDLFFPDGWMGDRDDILFDENYIDETAVDNKCLRIKYSANGSNKNNWAGIYWLFPNNNFGNSPEGRNLSGAKYITFLAKGNNGGEKAEFKVGGVSAKYQESCYPAASIFVTLTSKWEEYKIKIENKDLSNVFGGFCWVTNTTQNPKGCTIYLDKITYE